MASLADYIREYLDQGYDIDSIRSHLISSGYSQEEVRRAINSLYSNHVVHHLSKTTIITLAAVVLGIAIITASLLIFLSPDKEVILDIKLDPIRSEADPGEDITFIRELTNFGKKVDVTTTYEITSINTGKEIASYEETAAVETKATRQIAIKIPPDAAPGNAVVDAVARYKEKEAKAAMTISILGETDAPTCYDSIKNQGEEGIDCGGPCPGCEPERSCPVCDDLDKCTKDRCSKDTDYTCIHEPITPCCGNDLCEQGEDDKACPEDCIKEQEDIFTGLTPLESLDKIKTIAETDIKSAANYCDRITIKMYRDGCFRNIAEIAENTIFCEKIEEDLAKDRCYATVAKINSESRSCEKISKDSRRDSCYMNFVLDDKDYSVCDKLVNSYLRDSCQTLKRAEEG